MKGTILDFLKLAAEKPELAKELVDLAAKHDFEFSDEVSDEQLDAVSGGVSSTLSTMPPTLSYRAQPADTETDSRLAELAKKVADSSIDPESVEANTQL